MKTARQRVQEISKVVKWAVEKGEVVANCDHLSRLKFSKTATFAFHERGALMPANVLSSPEAVKMSVHVVRAFIKQRELLMAHSDVLKNLLKWMPSS